MVTNGHMQEINAILGKLTEEFNKNTNARERERLKKGIKEVLIIKEHLIKRKRRSQMG